MNQLQKLLFIRKDNQKNHHSLKISFRYLSKYLGWGSMVNLIWAFMAIIGIVYAMFNGTMEEVNKAVFESANEAVTLSIGLISVLVFWLGIMRIAEEAGLLRGLAKIFRPVVVRLFPD